MDPKLQPVFTGEPRTFDASATTVAAEPNRVLRNTYWLLALSLLPTVGGALVGMQMNFFAYFKAAPIMTPLLMFAAMLGSLFIVTRLRNSGWGVFALFGFTFISGVFLTPILTVAAQYKNGGELVALAGGLTAAIFFTMAAIATVTKRDFGFMANFLFVGMILIIIASLANLFFQIPALQLTIAAVAVLIFSAFILVDVSRIVHGGETNYVMATLQIFLDLYNVFVSLLQLLMAFTGQRD